MNIRYPIYEGVYRILTNKPYNKNLRILAIQFRKPEAAFTESCNKIPGYITNKKLF